MATRRHVHRERSPHSPWSLALDPARLAKSDAIFLCGRRVTAEVLLASEGVARTAMSPLDAFNTLSIRMDPVGVLESVTASATAVTKRWRFPGGGTLESAWRVDAERPLIQGMLTFRASRLAGLVFRMDVEVVSNVGWVNKFAQHDDDTGVATAGDLRFRDRAVPELELRVWTSPAGRPALTAGEPERPGGCSGMLSLDVSVRAGGRRTVKVYAASTDRAREMASLRRTRAARAPVSTLAGAFVFRCPDDELDQFVRACCATMSLNVRDLPFGPPYSRDGMANTRVPVVTASPDYHGVFANDCIQTLWEGGLLGPAFRAAAANSVDAMFRFGPTESVEWWTGNGKVWCFPLPLGDTPQIVAGACRHLLWTGDRVLAERWWPDMVRCLAVLDANDADGDELEDRPNTPYPEQPDPGEYNHEMLYVQCFWRQAFAQASRVAEWLGKPVWADLAAKSGRIAAAIEDRFGTPYGLGVWLDSAHRPHPHIGHEQIIAAAEGDVSDERSRLIVRTATTPPIWTPDGPLRAQPGHGVAAGDHVWTFMRWKLVQALFRLGEVDTGLQLARTWARQERELRYQAPEGFPTITGTTGKAYTWSAGRALRALVFGLSGMDLGGRGVRFAPRLPSAWDRLELDRMRVHGAALSLSIRRGDLRVLIDGHASGEAFVPYSLLRSGSVQVEVWSQ